MRRVVITGLGTINPMAKNTEGTWKGLTERQSGIKKITSCKIPQGFPPFAGEIEGEISGTIDGFVPAGKQAKRWGRSACLFLKAAEEALLGANLVDTEGEPVTDSQDISRIGCFLGNSMGDINTLFDSHKTLLEKREHEINPFLIPTALANIQGWRLAAKKFRFKGPTKIITTACASSLVAVADAFDYIRNGKADIMITGGFEAAIHPLTVVGFGQLKALSNTGSHPFCKQRNGFVPAEGATVIILEELEHARQRNVSAYAEITGCGYATDINGILGSSREGEGLITTMGLALRDASLHPNDIRHICTHATGTDIGDLSEAIAIGQVFGDNNHIRITATKSNLGHQMGAAGDFDVMVASLVQYYKIIPPFPFAESNTCPELEQYLPREQDSRIKLNLPDKMSPVNGYSLINANAFGGNCCSIIIGPYPETK